MIHTVEWVDGLDADYATRFWSHVRKSEGGCWEWQANVNPRWGYAQCKVRQKTRRAHRIAWMLTHGPIPGGLFVCHSCDNKLCVRPDHLWLGSQVQNVADMDAKGRANRPVMRMENNPQAKLTGSLIVPALLKNLSGVSINSIARDLGVSDVTLTNAFSGKTWKSVIPADLRRRWTVDHPRTPRILNCRNGHPYTPENTKWMDAGTKRQCRTCRSRMRRERYRRLVALARSRAADAEAAKGSGEVST